MAKVQAMTCEDCKHCHGYPNASGFWTYWCRGGPRSGLMVGSSNRLDMAWFLEACDKIERRSKDEKEEEV